MSGLTEQEFSELMDAGLADLKGSGVAPQNRHKLALSCGDNQIAGGVIELDGQDISNAVAGVSLEMRAGDIPRAVLHVFVGTTADLGEVTAHISPESHDLLVKLGWTPPEEP